MIKRSKLLHSLFFVCIALLLHAFAACAQSDSLKRKPPMDTLPAPLYLDPVQPAEARTDDLLKRMTLAEKIGQMTQIEKNSLEPGMVRTYLLGSVLSGGGGSPAQNNAQSWAQMVNSFQAEALQTRLKIPVIYGVDAVHGHGNLYGATIFPHNIGLGAANDPELVHRIGQATAEEMLATGIPWNFAPMVAVPQDIRWGRTYEGYSADTGIVTRLAVSYLQGLQTPPAAIVGQFDLWTLATPKHFIGDGGTTWGTSQGSLLDQGDTQMDEQRLRQLFMPPYQATVQAGAQSIMVSFSSWNGVKMHAQRYLLTDVFKGELGFSGFLISDWAAINQLPGDYYSQVVASINAGLDMIMVPDNAVKFIETLTQAVQDGQVSRERIDDAVRRILLVKFKLGLFERPYADPAYLETVGSANHRQIAREAVRKSLVLLKNKHHLLPLRKDTRLIYVAGQAADDIGAQSGGWTITWQGNNGAITPGTTILAGIQQVAVGARIRFNPVGSFDQKDGLADVGIVVLAEPPYAEGRGDRADLQLDAAQVTLLRQVRAQSKRLVAILLSGRPLVITEQLPEIDALVAAWLPGTEGDGVAEVLFGNYPFSGKLSYPWPATNLPTSPTDSPATPLFSLGYGLTTLSPER